MPLSAVHMFPSGPIESADIIQYFNLLTGAMTDQPVTLANTVAAGGYHGAGSVPFRVNGVAAQTANMQEVRSLRTDVNPIFAIGPDGSLNWGPGGGTATDVAIRRTGPGALQIPGLQVSGAGSTAAGVLGFSGTSLLVGDGTVIESINVGPWVNMAGSITLSQGSVVAATINLAHYAKVGRTAFVFVQLTAGASGSAGQPVIISGLPAAIAPLTANGATIVGSVYVGSSPPRYGGATMPFSNQIEILIDNAGVFGVTPSVALFSGEVISLTAVWETAS